MVFLAGGYVEKFFSFPMLRYFRGLEKLVLNVAKYKEWGEGTVRFPSFMWIIPKNRKTCEARFKIYFEWVNDKVWLCKVLEIVYRQSPGA